MDRAGERRHDRLGAVLPDAFAMARRDQPDRRIDDAVRRRLGRDHADLAPRPAGLVLLAVSLSERDGHLATIPQPIAVGFCLPDLLHRDVGRVLLHRHATRSGDGA